MNEFLIKMAAILEVEAVSETDVLKSFPQWDSLSVLSAIAMLESSYHVSLHATDIQTVSTAGELWKLAQSRVRP